MNTEAELLATLKSIDDTLKKIEILLQNNKSSITISESSSEEFYKKYGINQTFA